jgi:hypothetical protein
VANKLIGEKGVLFTIAYVKKFNEMEQRERADFEAKAATPRLTVFNTAVKNVLNGMSAANTPPKAVMDFLHGAYKPFGINVKEFNDEKDFYSATAIASALGMYSYHGRPHAQAVSAIIEKLSFNPENHIEIVPYSLVGFSMRYDEYVAQAVADWIEQQNYPRHIPHNDIEYHVRYKDPYTFEYGCEPYEQLSLFDDAEIDLDDDDWDFAEYDDDGDDDIWD